MRRGESIMLANYFDSQKYLYCFLIEKNEIKSFTRNCLICYGEILFVNPMSCTLDGTLFYECRILSIYIC